jgi:hypothetical protein
MKQKENKRRKNGEGGKPRITVVENQVHALTLGILMEVY